MKSRAETAETLLELPVMPPSSADFSSSSMTEIALMYGVDPDLFEFAPPASLPNNFVCCPDNSGALLMANRTALALVGLNTGSLYSNMRAQYDVRT